MRFVSSRIFHCTQTNSKMLAENSANLVVSHWKLCNIFRLLFADICVCIPMCIDRVSVWAGHLWSTHRAASKRVHCGFSDVQRGINSTLMLRCVHDEVINLYLLKTTSLCGAHTVVATSDTAARYMLRYYFLAVRLGATRTMAYSYSCG